MTECATVHVSSKMKSFHILMLSNGRDKRVRASLSPCRFVIRNGYHSSAAQTRLLHFKLNLAEPLMNPEFQQIKDGAGV